MPVVYPFAGRRPKMPRECRQGLFADVMLDSLGIGFGGDGVDAEPDQEIADDAVAFAAAFGQGAARFGQEDRAVTLILDQKS